MKPFVLSVATGLMLLFNCGCSTLHFMNSQPKIPEACLTTCWRLQVTPTKYLLVVNIDKQSAALFENGAFVKTYRCSTSRFGIGEIKDSNCTPRGLHRIAEKIGEGEPAGTIFKNREIVGHVSELGVKAGRITTRIMWLEGMEPGFNQGGNVDTHERYIYIHGTGDQESVGRPDSHGCIHFADADLITLFDLLPSGTLVWISEK